MAADPTLPESLRARFAPVRVLGEGGFGRVVLAEDRALDRRVAVKLLRDPEDPGARARFLREAEVLTSLRHAHVVEVFDCGEADGALYLVMEHLEGRPPAPGELSVEEVLQLGRDIGGALERVHGAGVLHRDVKRENVLVHPSRGAVLVDFGLARERERTRLTQQGAVVGTLGYLAPECLRGQEAGAAADWYALGVVLFELLTGRLPFDSVDCMAAVQGHALPALDLPASLRDPGLRAQLGALLDPDPGRRPVRVEAMERRRRRGASPAPRGRRGWGRGLGVAALLLAGALGWWTGRRADPGPVGLVPQGSPAPRVDDRPVLEALEAVTRAHRAAEGELPEALRGGGYAAHLEEVREDLADPRFPLRWGRLVAALESWDRRGERDPGHAEEAERLTRVHLLPALRHLIHDVGMVWELLNSGTYQGALGLGERGATREQLDLLLVRSEELREVLAGAPARLGALVGRDRVATLAGRVMLLALARGAARDQALAEALARTGTVGDPAELTSLVTHGSFAMSHGLSEDPTPCDLRAAMARRALEVLRLESPSIPRGLRVVLAGRVITSYFPVLSRCGADPGYDTLALFEAAADRLEVEADASPGAARLYLEWFRQADEVVLGALLVEDTKRWEAVARRLRAIRGRLRGVGGPDRGRYTRPR